MFTKQRTTNKQIAVQNLMNYKISEPNKTKLDSLLNNQGSFYANTTKDLEYNLIEPEPILMGSLIPRHKKLPQRTKSCIILNSPTHKITQQAKETKEDQKKKTVRVLRSVKRKKNKFRTSSQDVNRKKLNVHRYKFNSNSQPNSLTTYQKNQSQINKKTLRRTRTLPRTPTNLNRDKLRKMLFMCPTDPVTKHQKKAVLNSLARKRMLNEKNSVYKKLRFNDKKTTNSKNLIHRHNLKKDLFEQMILINNNDKRHQPKTKSNYFVSNRNKPQLVFKRPLPNKNLRKKKQNGIHKQKEIFFNDPKTNQVIQTIPKPNLNPQITKKNSNSLKKVELFNYNSNSPMKKNKLEFFRKPLNFGKFKTPIPLVKNNTNKKIDFNNKQIDIENVDRQKPKLFFSNTNNNVNELNIEFQKNGQSKGKEIHMKKNNDTKIRKKQSDNENDQDFILNNKKNILAAKTNNTNKAIEKNNPQIPKLDINFSGHGKEFTLLLENENENQKKSIQNTKNHINNTINKHNMHTDNQIWNKSTVFENFQKDRTWSIEFPEFYQKFDQSLSFYDFYLKILFNNNHPKKKSSPKKTAKIPKKFIIQMAKNPLKYTYSFNERKLIKN
ncbi:hypothetical protein M0812_26465 [Anaeramoeba flamelloides]|uniref:Uncharacterized protein n=1 Tax=Anaeramoeba flamelloides TaxID=1746091 RepID=A0AAV7YHE3_9EUKA|nr:hypothetical protein M0812_26465 [Anaeramoeba flamelloides]